MPAGYLTKKERAELTEIARNTGIWPFSTQLIAQDYFKHNQAYRDGYREGFEAGKKEILDELFPDEFRDELIKALRGED